MTRFTVTEFSSKVHAHNHDLLCYFRSNTKDHGYEPELLSYFPNILCYNCIWNTGLIVRCLYLPQAFLTSLTIKNRKGCDFQKVDTFLEHFQLAAISGRKYINFSSSLLAHIHTAFPTIKIQHQNGMFANEPTLSHHYHPQSTVYIRVHPQCCNFYRF